jgi:hypothetical protein
LLWTGQTVSQPGSQVTLVALPLTTILVLGATQFQVGLLTASHSTWERLNEKFRRNGRPPAQAGSMASCHTLSGILRCPKCGNNVVGAGNTGYNCRRSVVGLCEGFRIQDAYAEQQACEILDGVFAKLNVPENFAEAIQQERAARPSDRRAVLEDELQELAMQEDRLADAIADGLIEREAAQRKSARIKSRRLEIYHEIDGLAREKEARQRALQYVQMARTEGIGTLVLGMPIQDKRKFFRAAFKSITLDGHGRGVWRKRSVKTYELSEERIGKISGLHALGYTAQGRIAEGVTLVRTIRLR